MEALVFLTKKGNKATTSHLVAKGFERKHQHVLRLIDSVLENVEELSTSGQLSQEDASTLFHVDYYQDNAGNKQRRFLISERGFKLLAMRMTGSRALKFQFAFIKQFEELVLEVQQLRAQLNVAQATEEIARLANYTRIPVQIEAVKNVAGALITQPGKSFAVINHHRAVMTALTGERPSLYVSHALERGLKVKGKSGRAVLRICEPHKAATAAVLDDAIRQGKTIEEITVAGLADSLPRAFEAILALGLRSADLEADRQAA